ncbi:MAG: DUF4372 domain-containing protein [Ferrovum myxofaciens]|uniref:DUF4372 domain-containing protein n=1 Tax=Ferrovum myxofaciens TaxID=416213 RepID=A0A9E6SXJ8_9PROT|nr:MAG: DUF4372 domain-containing protein [Ferrovum myxofaciens]QWY74779.1 MAG: DUF4372 domain-containing protein [Ferrovum myxofaciens]QWY77527.1 MAG: DUF4372 domain-containing protein [Ferrovum myxofaciens]
MHTGKLVFAQLMEHLPLHTFRRCVAKYTGRYPTLTFSHLDQFLCMAFSQLTYRESLRDIETCLRAFYQVVSSGYSWRHCQKHSGRRQRKPRLAHLLGLCTQPDPDSAQALRRGQFRPGIDAYRLRARFHHH